MKRLAIFLFVFFLVGCGDVSNSSIVTVKQVIPSCEDRAKELIPNTVFLLGDSSGWAIDETHSKWTDGIQIPSMIPYYTSGTNVGENTNYLYARDFYGYEPNKLVYSKKVISSDGTILGTNTFSILPVLELLDKNKPADIDPREARIVSYVVSDCSFVE